MSRPMRGYHWIVTALAAASPAFPASAPQVSVSELAHCAAIVAVDQRLACYDSLALSKLPPRPAAAGMAATENPASAATAAPGFGIAQHAPPADSSTQRIVAHVVAGSADRQGNVFVTLDNGQAWTYPDQYGPPAVGSEVTIRRASLGSYLLSTSSHHLYRAQRTK